jgi:hypothetical protein
MQSRETFRDDGDISRADFEQAVAAERTAASTLQVLRLRIGDGAKKFVCPTEDARVRFVSHEAHNQRDDNVLSLVVYNRPPR